MNVVFKYIYQTETGDNHVVLVLEKSNTEHKVVNIPISKSVALKAINELCLTPSFCHTEEGRLDPAHTWWKPQTD